MSACAIYPQFGFSIQGSGETDNSGAEGKTVVYSPVSGEWKLVSVKAEDVDIVVPVYLDLVPTLEMSTDGKFHGFTGCNTFFGTLRVENDKLRFREIRSTSRECVGPVGRLENFVFRGLSRVDDYSMRQEKLYLKRGSDILMTYRRKTMVSF